MKEFLTFTVLGLIAGSAYAIAAMGLVVTYTTSKVFNVAHGAVGMLMSFLFWEIAYNPAHGRLPSGVALVLVVFVIAPLIGVIVERVAMRGLAGAPVGVMLVVTVGLLVVFFGVAQAVWKPEGRFVPGFFPKTSWSVFGAYVSANDAITVGASIAVAVGLYILLRRTRLGAAMRAVVDNGPLLSLHGARPAMLSALSWAIGAALAALAGILLVPQVQLDYYQLTLLVVNAYAAAMLGRLESLPLTFLGAVLLGLAQNYAVGYLPTSGLYTNLRPAIPTIFLFALLLILRQPQLRVGQIAGQRAVPVPSARRTAGWGAALVLACWVASLALNQERMDDLSLALVYGAMMLSLVPLTGYGGFVSLGQFTFVGVGAVVAAKWLPGSPLGLLLAGAVTAAVGALVALPVLRLRGLYLALATLAFAELMDKLVFPSSVAFKYVGGSLDARRLHVGGARADSPRALLMIVAIAFVVIGAIVLALRRGRYGRLVIALRDSPAACGTLGLSLTSARVSLFALSAGLAGVAGGLYDQRVGRIGPEQFQFFNSLPLLLLAVVGGLTSVTGALLGGLLLMLKDVLPGQSITAAGVLFVVIGVAAMSLGRNPNGLANLIFSFGRRLMPAWAAAPAPRGTTTGPAENAPVLDPLLDTGPLPVYAGFSREEVGLRASP